VAYYFVNELFVQSNKKESPKNLPENPPKINMFFESL
jgi:hypothetical protein